MKPPVAAFLFSPGLRVPAPRLLPVTMLVMAALLAVKSVALVRAAAPAGAASAPAEAAATPAPPMPAATPADAKAAGAKVADTKQPADKPAGSTTAAASAGKPAEGNAAVAAPPPGGMTSAPPISDSERALLLDLRKRRDELDAREAALRTREALLAAAEARLTVRVAELAALQKRLETLEATRKDRDEANWKGLVKLYESMKPKDAATIFNDLDLPVLLPLVDRMNERKAALVLAAMLPERARLVTEELARMRARGNTVPPLTTSPAATTAVRPAGG